MRGVEGAVVKGDVSGGRGDVRGGRKGLDSGNGSIQSHSL